MPKKNLPTDSPSFVKDVSRVGDNISFLRSWAKRNEDTFERVMDMLAQEAPQKYAEIYIKIKQMEVANTPKTSNHIEKVNIQVNKLDALSDVKDPSWRDNDTPYEEIK